MHPISNQLLACSMIESTQERNVTFLGLIFQHEARPFCNKTQNTNVVHSATSRVEIYVEFVHGYTKDGSPLNTVTVPQ